MHKCSSHPLVLSFTAHPHTHRISPDTKKFRVWLLYLISVLHLNRFLPRNVSCVTFTRSRWRSESSFFNSACGEGKHQHMVPNVDEWERNRGYYSTGKRCTALNDLPSVQTILLRRVLLSPLHWMMDPAIDYIIYLTLKARKQQMCVSSLFGTSSSSLIISSPGLIWSGLSSS